MGWFEDQLLSRRKRDNAALSDAYLRLAHYISYGGEWGEGKWLRIATC